jgi:hypothetical protein
MLAPDHSAIVGLGDARSGGVMLNRKIDLTLVTFTAYNGSRMGIVQCADGTWGVTVDGVLLDVIWGRWQLSECVEDTLSACGISPGLTAPAPPLYPHQFVRDQSYHLIELARAASRLERPSPTPVPTGT